MAHRAPQLAVAFICFVALLQTACCHTLQQSRQPVYLHKRKLLEDITTVCPVDFSSPSANLSSIPANGCLAAEISPRSRCCDAYILLLCTFSALLNENNACGNNFNAQLMSFKDKDGYFLDITYVQIQCLASLPRVGDGITLPCAGDNSAATPAPAPAPTPSALLSAPPPAVPAPSPSALAAVPPTGTLTGVTTPPPPPAAPGALTGSVASSGLSSVTVVTLGVVTLACTLALSRV